jgi:hypothetical protein
MTEETIVRLKILSHTRPPEGITAMVGLQCDKCWHSGDTRKHTTIVEKDNGWILHSGLPKTADLDTQIRALLDALEPAKGTIRDLSMTETVELSVVMYTPSLPALSFDATTIARMAELGAGMDIDLYVT